MQEEKWSGGMSTHSSTLRVGDVCTIEIDGSRQHPVIDGTMKIPQGTNFMSIGRMDNDGTTKVVFLDGPNAGRGEHWVTSAHLAPMDDETKERYERFDYLRKNPPPAPTHRLISTPTTSKTSDQLIACSGAFDFVPLFDIGLNEEFRYYDTGNEAALQFVRVCRIPISPRHLIAVSGRGFSGSIPLLCCDLESREIVSRCIPGHSCPISGFASLICAGKPVVVSGGNSDSLLVVCDPLKGERLVSMRASAFGTRHLLHVPEWHKTEVFAASGGSGSDGQIRCYDLVRQKIAGPVFDDHRRAVQCLCPVISRHVLISVSADRTARFWSTQQGRDTGFIQTLSLSSSAYSCYCAEDKNVLFVGLATGEVQMWDLRMLRPTKLKGTSPSTQVIDQIDRIDENKFVSCSEDHSLTTWNPFADGEEGTILNKIALPSQVYGVSVSSVSSNAESREVKERIGFLLLAEGMCSPERVGNVAEVRLIGDASLFLASAWLEDE